MKPQSRRCRMLSALVVVCLAISAPISALSYQPGTLRSGMRGEEVRQMQAALIRLGYLGGTADGIFGTNTENAVKKFQKSSRLKADGLAGSKPWRFCIRKQAAPEAVTLPQRSRPPILLHLHPVPPAPPPDSSAGIIPPSGKGIPAPGSQLCRSS